MSIEVSALTKRFGQFVALNNVSIRFPENGLIALLGPSGCGKTTLLRVIAGLERPDSGLVKVKGCEISGLDIRQRQIGFVFQHYALFKHMSVFDNVAFGLRVKARGQRLSTSAIKRKVDELLNLVQLDWLAGRYPAQLSGGQRQRVALARALAIDPQVLLLDEPFGALDAQVRKELRRWLRELHQSLNTTSLFVTHDQEEALEVADRVVVMNQGTVEQYGSPEEVYNQPASEFVYRFVGSSNRLYKTAGGYTFSYDGDIATSERWYCRPHDVDVFTSPTSDAAFARVSRTLSLGCVVRIEALTLNKQSIEVEIANQDPLISRITPGDHIWLRPRQTCRFSQPLSNDNAL
ncbi:sulfate/molybdate ABC transporter ATP-binding protein [Vibrio ouci]|uniref:Sulfate ABC transporter ATP-binding protein n=1 Tax=Vibrio ouci TaxID=2499078 RepID=A0A4Y8WBF4_9VIBR|nr:sulfate ABC transporter ATP-binding protein [Vibrio ouci]TFH90279.1 sulfate ABC transporter ATP-binding protein [Vibrio ouci]